MTRTITQSGGKLGISLPANICGSPIGAGAKYDVAINGEAIEITFAYEGSRMVSPLGLISAPGKTASMSSAFRYDIDQEAKTLGLKSGTKVKVEATPIGDTCLLRLTPIR